MSEKLKYLRHAVIHPFDGFYEIRFRGKGSILLAFIVLAIFGIVQCAAFQYTGFVINNNPVYKMNSFAIFISNVFIIVLAAVSNWTVTSLFNGKGNMASIFMVITYSLVPLIITKIIVILLSNVMTLDEAMLIYMIEGIGIVWTAFLIVSGLCVIHEYGLLKNIVVILATLIAALLIIFLMVLFLSLEERMFGFISAVVKEFIRRAVL